MRKMPRWIALLAAVTALASCGGDDGDEPAAGGREEPAAAATVPVDEVLAALATPGTGWSRQETLQAATPAGEVIEGRHGDDLQRTVALRWEDGDVSRMETTTPAEGEPRTVETIFVGDTRFNRYENVARVSDEAEGTWLERTIAEMEEDERPLAGTLLAALFPHLTDDAVETLADGAEAVRDGDEVTVTFPASPALAYYGSWAADLVVTTGWPVDGPVERLTFQGLTAERELGLVVAEGVVEAATSSGDAPVAPVAPAEARPSTDDDFVDAISTATRAPLTELAPEAPDPLAALAPGSCAVRDTTQDAVVRMRVLVSGACDADGAVEVVARVPIEEPTPQRPDTGFAMVYTREFVACRAAVARHLGDATGTFVPDGLLPSIVIPDLAAFSHGDPHLLCMVERGDSPDSIAGGWENGAAARYSTCFSGQDEVGCDQPHDFETFARIDLTDVTENLTEDEVRTRYTEECVDLVEAFTGASLPELVTVGVFQDAYSSQSRLWDQDRAAYCHLTTNRPVTGSAYGTGARLGT